MTPAKSGRPGMGAGEVFVEVTEKKHVPGFWFLGGAELASGGAKRRDFAEKVPKSSALGDPKLTTCDSIAGDREPKWKSRIRFA
jgi:hypothetical protein